MAKECKIHWPYLRIYQPHLGIILESPSGDKWPQEGDDEALVDTGFDGDVLIPETLYNSLNFSQFESFAEDLYTAGSDSIPCIRTQGFLHIPKIGEKFQVECLSSKDRNTNSILIGNKFLKKFRLILDGPNEKLIFCPKDE